MHKRSSVIFGIILIGVGLLFLAVQLFPDLALNLNMGRQWPLAVVSVGGLLILSAFFGSPQQAISGSITTGIGGILYVQNLTNSWSSWAYTWTLIPGFVGVGLILAGLLGHKRRSSLRAGSRLLLISAALFLVFGAIFNGLGALGRYWPILFIGLGLWMLLPRRKVPKEKL